MKRMIIGAVLVCVLSAIPALAQQDADGCKDHPLFTRFPRHAHFGLREQPVRHERLSRWPPRDGSGQATKAIEVEGPCSGSATSSTKARRHQRLQIMRNFENAAKKAGATIEGQYPGCARLL